MAKKYGRGMGQSHCSKTGNNIDTVEDTVLKGLNDITKEIPYLSKMRRECYLTKNSEVKVIATPTGRRRRDITVRNRTFKYKPQRPIANDI